MEQKKKSNNFQSNMNNFENYLILKTFVFATLQFLDKLNLVSDFLK